MFKNRNTRESWIEKVGENYSFEVRVEDGSTTYEPAGKNAADAETMRLKIAAKFDARAKSEAAGLVEFDPAKEEKQRLRLEDAFDDYIEDAGKRNALEAKKQARLVKAEFLHLVPITHADQVTRDRILTFDEALREHGRAGRTIANKRQQLQSMLHWAGVDPKIFPPKPKYDKKLPTIYSSEQLQGLFRAATPYEATVSNLALKLGLRDQELQFSEFTDISWHESVFRVRSKLLKFGFEVKDYEERDIPIPLGFLEKLKAWKSVLTRILLWLNAKGKPNTKLLRMIKLLARRAGTNCGWCANCLAGLKGDRGFEQFELHRFRRTCITTWLRNRIDPLTVIEYAGHADLETTLRYLRPAAA